MLVDGELLQILAEDMQCGSRDQYVVDLVETIRELRKALEGVIEYSGEGTDGYAFAMEVLKATK